MNKVVKKMFELSETDKFRKNKIQNMSPCQKQMYQNNFQRVSQ